MSILPQETLLVSTAHALHTGLTISEYRSFEVPAFEPCIQVDVALEM